MTTNITDILYSTKYSMIYAMLHNYYISKSPEILELALTKCRDNLNNSYYDYENFKFSILSNDIVIGLELMDKLNIPYDRNSALSRAQMYKATLCCEYLSKLV